MKKSFLHQFKANLEKQTSDIARRARRHKASRKRARREEEVHSLARSQRAARAQASRLRSARRTIAERTVDLQETFHWVTVVGAVQQAQRTLKKKIQAIRRTQTINPVFGRYAFRLVALVALGSLLANVVLYNRYSSSRPLVTIGHRVVSKSEYLKDLHDAAGKAVLSKIVFTELITQAAAKSGVTPTENDINQRLAALRRRKPGSVPADDTPELRAQVGQLLALENLRIQGITASDSEIAAYYAAHQADFTLPPQAQASLVVAEDLPDANQAVQLLAQDMPEAAIAAHHGLHVAGVDGFQVNMNVLSPAVRGQLTSAVMGLKTGEIKSFRLGKTFLIFKMKNHDSGAVLPLAQVRDQVARQVKLQKAPSEQAQIVTLYKSNKPSFDMPIYKDYFSDLENAARPPKPGDPAKTASLPQ